MTVRTKKPLAVAGDLRAALLGLDVERRAELDRLNKADLHLTGRNDLLPHLEQVQRDPNDLVIPKRNVRKSKSAHVREVANAIQVLGFTVPVLIDECGNILDGVSRVKAAKLLKLPHIPCIMTTTHTAVEKRLVRLAANRLGEKGAFDVQMLHLEAQELILEGAPIEVTGIEDFVIDGLAVGEPDAIEQGPLEPQGREAVSRLGDIFVLGHHRVACGSALDAGAMLRLTAGRIVRLVSTDEPYNVPISGHVTSGRHREFAMASGEMDPDAFLAFNDAWIAIALSHLIVGGLLATFIDWRGLPSVTAAALSAGLSQINLIVWVKTNAGMGSLYRSQHELLPLFVKGSAPSINNVELGKKGRWRSNVWRYPGASSINSDTQRGLKDHPTVKPVAMLVDAIRDVTNRGDIVLDPFLGSGSTLIACEKMERACYGMEIDPLYVDLIVTRYSEVTRKPVILEETGETFAELAARRQADARRDTVAAQAVAAPSTARVARPRPARNVGAP